MKNTMMNLDDGSRERAVATRKHEGSRALRVAFAITASVTVWACSSAELGTEALEPDVIEQATGLYPEELRSVSVERRPGEVLAARARRALDSQNALPPGTLSHPALRGHLRQLARAGLVDGGGVIAAMGALPNGRELVRYIVRCALDETQWVGEHRGRLALAPSWSKLPLDTLGKRWITACLMAHSNNRGPVNIAVSGELPPSASGPHAEGPIYRIEEAAFFGNVFESNPTLYACTGAGAQPRCGDRGVSHDLEHRICGADPRGCGFTFLGRCEDLTKPERSVCAKGMPYKSCVAPTGHFDEVLTTSLLTDADFLGLHPGCQSGGVRSEPHGLCVLGAPLARTHSVAAAQVCARDPYCCTYAWDSQCMREAGCADSAGWKSTIMVAPE